MRGILMVNVGERMRYIRETYDASQKEIAEYLGVSKSSICHYEKNNRDIPLKSLAKFADYFNFSIDYVLGFTSIKNYSDKSNISLKKTAKRIEEICLENKWTNVKMAKELNTCESSIRNYKRGTYIILLSFAIQLHYKYNYSIDWIIGRTDNKYIVKKGL